MQWTDGENRGFSTAKELYLPVDYDSASVQSESSRPDGLLQTVKKLIALHKKLPYTAEVRVMEASYPFVYERICNDGVYTVFLQPALQSTKRLLDFDEIIDCENCVVEKGMISTEGVGYAIVFRKS